MSGQQDDPFSLAVPRNWPPAPRHSTEICSLWRRVRKKRKALSDPQVETQVVDLGRANYPGESNVVRVLEGGISDEAGRPHAVGCNRHHLQEEHAVRVRKAPPGFAAAAVMAEAKEAEAGVLGVHEGEDVGVVAPHARHDLPHLRHRHEPWPAALMCTTHASEFCTAAVN